jgi:hypothetical protein
VLFCQVERDERMDKSVQAITVGPGTRRLPGC